MLKASFSPVELANVVASDQVNRRVSQSSRDWSKNAIRIAALAGGVLLGLATVLVIFGTLGSPLGVALLTLGTLIALSCAFMGYKSGGKEELLQVVGFVAGGFLFGLAGGSLVPIVAFRIVSLSAMAIGATLSGTAFYLKLNQMTQMVQY